MSIKQRVAKLEAKANTDAGDGIRVHLYETDDDERPWREACPTCAAMSDEEYAAYEAKTANTKHVTHIAIVRPEEPSNATEQAS